MVDGSSRRAELRRELQDLDQALYVAVAATPTPVLDSALLQLTSAADHSKIWLGVAAGLACLGGRRGRRAALHGVASIALASASVNLVAKQASRRRRPDRDSAAVPDLRRVPMPASTSFPSGHSASAFAFAGGVGHTMPVVAVPLTLAGSLVAYTRVHAGVHYPADMIAGCLAGIACGHLAPWVIDHLAAGRPK